MRPNRFHQRTVASKVPTSTRPSAGAASMLSRRSRALRVALCRFCSGFKVHLQPDASGDRLTEAPVDISTMIDIHLKRPWAIRHTQLGSLLWVLADLRRCSNEKRSTPAAPNRGRAVAASREGEMSERGSIRLTGTRAASAGTKWSVAEMDNNGKIGAAAELEDVTRPTPRQARKEMS